MRAETKLVRYGLILLAAALTVFFIALPLAAVFVQAFDKGCGVWQAAVTEENAREAIWLVRAGVTDLLLGYPSADRGALAELGSDPSLHGAITLMVYHVQQLERIRSVTDAPLRVCLDVDA